MKSSEYQNYISSAISAHSQRDIFQSHAGFTRSPVNILIFKVAAAVELVVVPALEQLEPAAAFPAPFGVGDNWDEEEACFVPS